MYSIKIDQKITTKSQRISPKYKKKKRYDEKCNNNAEEDGVLCRSTKAMTRAAPSPQMYVGKGADERQSTMRHTRRKAGRQMAVGKEAKRNGGDVMSD